ncbi:TPA: type III pantothenate kinase [Candidatus Poribacteria bacterium]|nr:type III pantothenate kinase [Candidatus Poribacteria bacterium]
MILAVDIGNTTIQLGVIEDNQIQNRWRLQTNRLKLADEYAVQVSELFRLNNIVMSNFEAVVVSSVVPSAGREFTVMCRHYLEIEPVIVSPDLDLDIDLRVNQPEEIGADRITTAIAAFSEYGGPLIIVDFGTATTFDAVADDGAYLGGVIVPGIQISMNALFDQAALLSRVDLSMPPRVIGTTTKECIQSGFYFGFLCQMEGIIDRIKEELNSAVKVIATGGLSSLIAENSAKIDIVDPDLMIKGLYTIFQQIQKKNR